ncbi:Putative multidrug export ATP-binding/permease protein [Paraliobacillus sp. PM-2]|uniref:thiol reductant ABC exporter subunit CydC n=1 Tax=Paraliobacillus sp. PM-2 TaxID=1462524 RepID=UPI00061C0482|nr:thiol reductant ABC exporter subunit CydC [Paraliobacillus sp. PM-2]CQR47557.1 Putative multidrug export ATP-binding/permease protein [Paraliobacillus sp. PM-2]
MAPIKQLIQFLFMEKKDIFYAVLFGFIAGIASVGLFAASGYLISKAALETPLYALIVLTSTVKLLGFIKAGAKYGERLVSHRATFTILSNLRVNFFEKLEPLVPQVFRKYRSGDILGRVVGDVESLQNFFLRVFYPPIVLVLVFISTIFFTSFYSFSVAMILLVGYFVTTFIIPLLFSIKQMKIKQQVRANRGELSTEVTEYMFGDKELKLFQQSEEKKQALLQHSDAYIQAQNRENMNKVFNQSVTGFITFVTSWFVLALGAYLVANGNLDGIFLAMLVMISLTVFEPMAPMGVFPIYYQESQSAVSRLNDVVEDTEIEIDEGNGKINTTGAPAIRVNNVSFNYFSEWRKTLSDITLKIDSGTKTAIVGASGSGKSTLLQLLIKLQFAEGGRITWNNQKYDEIAAEEIWEQSKVVLQENHFFYGTVQDNLLLANPQVTDKELNSALERVLLSDFALTDHVAERGENLSGGEKQRLAIARALLKQGDLWVLDEPTSSLDAKTEKMILDDIYQSATNDTLLLVSHRINGLEKMDQIIVMEHGRIIEQGSYDALMKQKGYLYEMKQLEQSLLI